MTRRAVETLAALFAGAVLLDPVAEALFYGWWVAPGAALAAFTLAAALAGRAPVDAVYGLLGLVVSVPLLIGLVSLVDVVRGGSEPLLALTPIWVCALVTALAMVLWRPPVHAGASPAPAESTRSEP